jgi:hypothetical protein
LKNSYQRRVAETGGLKTARRLSNYLSKPCRSETTSLVWRMPRPRYVWRVFTPGILSIGFAFNVEDTRTKQ